MTENGNTLEFEFKAEIKQLLDILVHSLYTNQEIFLRELISNASDALEKLRFETARGTEVADPGTDLAVRISVDADQNRLVIEDTGVGMTREEIVADIGTIARSGSAEFLKKAADTKDGLDHLIGKFGVGFYSVFMAADEVEIRTRSYRKEEPPVVWRSDGLGTYEVGPGEEGLARGTRVEVRLKEEAKEFADKSRIEAIIQKHSNFISFPIFVDGERINTVPAIWREPKFTIKPDQYNEFYKFLTYDAENPLLTLHISVDAPVQFNSLLFVPAKSAGFPDLSREPAGLDLYVSRVLIQRGNKDLLPEYLGFVRGVVDSEDLTLNISRETLQENATLGRISTNMTKQVLGELGKTGEQDRDKYEAFWREHGQVFKLGYGDFANREKYAQLLRFNSSASDDAKGLVSLDEYMARAKPDQNEIYYVFGHSREAIALNPHMELFRAKGVEVLYLYEPVDEFALESVRTYKDYTLRSVEHVDPSVLEKFESETVEKKAEPLSGEDEAEFDKFLARIKDILGDRITDVKVSSRLSESPCCLVNPDGALTSSMQKILQIASHDASIPPKVFEVNQDHKLVRNLLAIFKKNPQDGYLTSVVEQVFESALLLEGYLRDPHAMVSRIQSLIDQSSDWYLSIIQPE